MGIFSELRKSCRNREDYRNQVRKLTISVQDKDREIARLRKKLELVEDFCRRSLA